MPLFLLFSFQRRIEEYDYVEFSKWHGKMKKNTQSVGFWMNLNTEAISLDKFSAVESPKCEGTQWGSKPMRHKDQQEQTLVYLLYLIFRVSSEVRTRFCSNSHSNWHANLRYVVRQLLFDFSTNRLFLDLVFILAFLFFFLIIWFLDVWIYFEMN